MRSATSVKLADCAPGVKLSELCWDRYALDPHASPMPYLQEETLHSYFLVEPLLPTFSSSSAAGPSSAILHDYKWRVSFWHDRKHRLSADVLLPLRTSGESRSAASALAAMASSTFASSSFAAAAVAAAEANEPSPDVHASPVYALHFDWLHRSQQREANYSTPYLTPQPTPYSTPYSAPYTTHTGASSAPAPTPGSGGMYLTVELVHRLSGVPLSRGSIRLSPNPRKTLNSPPISFGAAAHALQLDSSACYSLTLVRLCWG